MTKTKKIVYYILLVLVSVMFVFSAYSKLSGDPMAAAGFAKAHLPLWFMYFIGIAELAGGIGLWIPKLQKWAIYGLYIILVGAVVVTAIFENPLLALFPVVFIILLTIILKLDKKMRLSTSVPTDISQSATI